MKTNYLTVTFEDTEQKVTLNIKNESNTLTIHMVFDPEIKVNAPCGTAVNYAADYIEHLKNK